MLISLVIILIIVPIMAYQFVYLPSRRDEETQEKRRESDHGLTGGGLDIGSILEDPNYKDPDRDWLSKGLEDEFPSTGDTDSSSGEGVSSDSSSDVGGGSDSGSDSGSSDSW